MKAYLNCRGVYSESRTEGIVGVTIAFTVLASLIVTFRIYTRIKIVRAMSTDDYFIVASLVLAIAMTVAVWEEGRLGLGRHIQTLRPDKSTPYLKWYFVSLHTYAASLACTKTSILFSYLRFLNTDKNLRLVTRITLVFIYIYWTYGALFQTFICNPVAYFWDKSLPGGHCLPNAPLWFSYAALNMVSDLIILVIPMPALFKLRINLKSKFWLVSTFALGGCVFLISLIRIPNINNLLRSTDLTWDAAGATYLSSIEVDVAIICACIPPLKPFVVLYFPGLFSTTTKQRVSDQ